MSTHALPRPTRALADSPATRAWQRHATWLAGGFLLAFLIPFVLADTLEVGRDLYYGLYASAVSAFVWLWARATGVSLAAAVRRRLPLTLALAALAGAVLAVMVFRAEDTTARPGGLELATALAWRGVVYGAADGLLLSAFPVLAVFGAFAGTRLRRSRRGTTAVAALALAASLAMTAVYHVGYSDFRSGKLRKPIAGDVVWSAPTLLTLNPVGAPLAHVVLHTSAVLHSYETDTFLPPHPTGG